MDPYNLWIKQVCESDSTAKYYLHGILKFEAWVSEFFGLKVKELPRLWRQAKYNGEVAKEKFLDQLKDVINTYFVYLKGKYTPLSVNREMSTVISFLHSFEIPIKLKRLKYPYVVFHNRDITKEELCLILDHSTVRNQAAYLMLYESGMRPDTLVKLRFKHIKNEFLAGKTPMKIDLPADILKCRISERWTFIGDEAHQALKKHLVTRLPLKDEDYVFVREKPKGGKLRANALSQAFGKTVLKLGIVETEGKRKPKLVRLYCLKKAFRKFMVVEEAYKEFWMGRSDTIVHYVSRDIEYHRKLYAEGYENMRLHERHISSEGVVKLLRDKAELETRVKELEQKWLAITPEDVESVKKFIVLAKKGKVRIET